MKARCYNENNPGYPDYGGRGIKVCDQWLGENGFINFYDWAIESGFREGLSIDRIDVNGDYSPDNCRWADVFTQNNNTRRNKNYTWNGETHSLSVWGRIKPNGLGYETLRARLRDGWSVEEAFSTPQFDQSPDHMGDLVTIDGETHNVDHWCNIKGMDKSTYYRRLKKGMSKEEAITKPVDKKRWSKERWKKEEQNVNCEDEEEQIEGQMSLFDFIGEKN